MRRLTAPALVLALLATLSACTPTAVTSPAPSASRSALESPIPTPSLPAATVPAFGYDIGCAGLLDGAEAQAQLIAPVSVVVDETNPRIRDLPLAQASGITCIWGGKHRTDSSYDDSVTVSVLPAAQSELAAWNAAGARTCAADQPICTVDALAAGAWIEVTLSAAGGSPSPIETEAAAVASTVGTRIAGAARRSSSWKAPSDALAGISDCGSAVGEAGEAGGVDGSVLTRWSSRTPDASQSDVAERRTGYTSCSWSSADGSLQVSWSVLPGGGWAFAGLSAAHPPVYGWGIAAHPASIDGATMAWTGCGPSCALIAEVRDSLVTSDYDPDLDEAILDAKAAATIAAFAP